jgi:hypothetical protein
MLAGCGVRCLPYPRLFRWTPSGTLKEARTAAQRKINSQLLYEIYRRRGVADKKGIPPGPTDVRIDKAGRALVDVRADLGVVRLD